jgi:hypothetical protein
MWEYPAMILLLIVVFLTAAAIRKSKITRFPEYRFFIWGLLTKVLGGLLFASIYVFYYGQGDTTSFYECSLAFCKLFLHDTSDFFTAYFGGGTQEVKSYFTSDTGEPLMYMFAEGSTRFTMKLLVPFMLLSGGSYFITTVLVAIFTYGGLWQLFRMFYKKFPQHAKGLAVAILFMPSVMFWGSGIMKDSFTLAATCYLIVAIYNLIESKGNKVLNVLRMILFAFVVVSIKAYVIVILLPSTLVWMLYNRVRKVRNKLVRKLILPFVYVIVITGSYFGLNAFGESLGKFSVKNALKTAAINQNDLKQDYYEGNSFDIGDFDPTIGGALSKFPQATLAGLFRPYVWDSRNVVMFLSALENLFVLGFTLLVLFRLNWSKVSSFMVSQPLLLYCLVFSVLFAFMIGLTSPNYGALVRFRIPLTPLYMTCLMVLNGELKAKRQQQTARDNTTSSLAL